MPDPIDGVLVRAAELTAAGHPQAAVALLRPALAEHPDHSGGWCRLAAALLDAGEPNQSLDAAKRAIVLGERSWAHRLAGLALYELGRHDEAAVSAREAARRDPADWRGQVTLAEVLAETSPEEAVVAGRRAVAEAPEEARTHEVLGDVALRAQEWSLAKRAYRDALRLDPANDRVRVELGRLAGIRAEATDRDAKGSRGRWGWRGAWGGREVRDSIETGWDEHREPDWVSKDEVERPGGNGRKPDQTSGIGAGRWDRSARRPEGADLVGDSGVAGWSGARQSEGADPVGDVSPAGWSAVRRPEGADLVGDSRSVGWSAAVRPEGADLVGDSGVAPVRPEGADLVGDAGPAAVRPEGRDSVGAAEVGGWSASGPTVLRPKGQARSTKAGAWTESVQRLDGREPKIGGRSASPPREAATPRNGDQADSVKADSVQTDRVQAGSDQAGSDQGKSDAAAGSGTVVPLLGRAGGVTRGSGGTSVRRDPVGDVTRDVTREVAGSGSGPAPRQRDHRADPGSAGLAGVLPPWDRMKPPAPEPIPTKPPAEPAKVAETDPPESRIPTQATRSPRQGGKDRFARLGNDHRNDDRLGSDERTAGSVSRLEPRPRPDIRVDRRPRNGRERRWGGTDKPPVERKPTGRRFGRGERVALWLVVWTAALWLLVGTFVLMIAGMPSPSALLVWFAIALLLGVAGVTARAVYQLPDGARVAPKDLYERDPLIAVTGGILAVAALVLTIWTIALGFGARGMQLLTPVLILAGIGALITWFGLWRMRTQNS